MRRGFSLSIPQESVFFLAECLTVVHFGRASDRYGRRPVLLFGPIGLALSMLGFGLSKRFWPLVVFRCMQGAFNGNIGLCPETGQLLALTLLIRRFEERYGRGKFSFSFSYICLIELTDIRLHKHRRNIFTSSVHVGFRRHAWVCSLIYRTKQGLRGVSSPLIGGTLANPAVRYPDTLGKIHILREFPYLLPCAAAGSLAFCAFIFGFLGLKEV